MFDFASVQDVVMCIGLVVVFGLGYLAGHDR